MRLPLIAMLMLCAGCATLESRPPPVQPDAAAEVRVVAEKFLVAFDNLEWEPFKAAWAASPSVFFPFPDTPRRIDGKAEVERVFAAFFKDVRATTPGPPYLRLNPQELQVQVLGDSALVTFMLIREHRVSRRSLLFVREAGEWKLVHMHASNVDQ